MQTKYIFHQLLNINSKNWFTLCFFCVVFSSSSAQNLVKYVQPLSGTAPSTTLSAIKHSEGDSKEKNANTIPSVGLPFGMTQWTAQTQMGEAKCFPPYLYKSNKLNGFRATHWISGSCMQDYGSFTFMPITGKLQVSESEYAASFSHQDEITSPAFYQVKIPRYNLTTAMTATLRSAMLQFTVNKTDSLYLLIMPNSDQGKGYIKIDHEKGEIYGYNPVHRIYQGWGKLAGFSGYFVMKIERSFSKMGTFANGKIYLDKLIKNQGNLGAYLGFKLQKGETLRIKVGTSFSSIAGARKNLMTEIANWDFNALVKKNTAIWEQALSQIVVASDAERDKRIFYTALYHAMQHPRLYNDVDGSYPRFAGDYQIEKLKSGNYYDDFSMWDIYRAQLPLIEILQPKLVNNWVSSMVTKGTQGGWLPIFPCWNNYTAAMIGDHVTAFISSVYAKGIKDYNVTEAYKLMRQNAFEIANAADYKNGMGRRALDSYLTYGYIPMQDSVAEAFHKKEQVSRTLEYAYDDYALAQVAKAIGKKEDYIKLMSRSKNYQHVFDKDVKMVRGKNTDGTWYQPFKPNFREPYITEGTPRQYTFYVPHDVPGLAKLMGGNKQLENQLDSLFDKDEYWHGNEPGHQIPFMYNFTASLWKATKEVNRILKEEYNDGPGGLSGNDDAGQMSAWYVFATMGFYPLDPVSAQYLIVAPNFKNIKIKLSNQHIFEITRYQKTSKSAYIKSVRLNGKPYLKTFFTYADLSKGGKLEIFLEDQPSKWGSDPKNQPTGL